MISMKQAGALPGAPSDPLLTAARAVITITRVLLIVTFAGLSFGVVAGIIGHGVVVTKVVAAGAPPVAAWAITGMLALFAALILMAERFLRRLGEIVATVAEGDPFVLANARRLEQMGWLVLAINLIAIPIGAIVGWLSGYIEDLHIDVGFSFGGLMTMLILFVLARVFRQGSAMREELEGTV